MANLDKAFLYGLMAIACCLPFVRLYHYIEYVFVILLIIWLGKNLRAESFVLERTSLDIPILLFLGWVLLTVPFATDWTYSFAEWRKTITRALMFWFVVNVVTTERQVQSILHAFSLGFVLMVTMETFHFFAQGGDLFSMDIRSGSFSGSSQWLSNYVVIGFPLLGLGFIRADRSIARAAYSLAIALSVVGLFLVHTRAAWVAVLVQIAVFVLWRFTRSWYLTGSVAFLIVGVLLMVLALPGQHLSLLSKSDFTNPETMLIRYNTWKVAFDDIGEHPVSGIGYGKHSFGKKHPDSQEGVHTNIHNAFLSHAVQIGVPGFLFLLWIFWRVLKHCGQRLGKGWDDFQGDMALALLLMIVGLIVRNLFDDMFGGTIVYLFWLFVGLSFALNKTQAGPQSHAVWKFQFVR